MAKLVQMSTGLLVGGAGEIAGKGGEKMKKEVPVCRLLARERKRE